MGFFIDRPETPRRRCPPRSGGQPRSGGGKVGHDTPQSRPPRSGGQSRSDGGKDKHALAPLAPNLYAGLTTHALQQLKPHLLRGRLRKNTNDLYTEYARRFTAIECTAVFPVLPSVEQLAALAASPIEHLIVRIEFEQEEHLGKQLLIHTGWTQFINTLLEARQTRSVILILALTRDVHYDAEALTTLSHWTSEASSLDIGIEAEHWSWTREAAFTLLEQHLPVRIMLDRPKLPGLTTRPLEHLTARQTVIYRLLGRNLTSWLQHSDERFEHVYTSNEIAEVASNAALLADTTRRTIVIAATTPPEHAITTLGSFEL